MTAVEKLKALRIDNDLTQNEIAKILNCKQSAISKYECERSKYSLDDLKKLCEYYNISADYILDLPERMPYPKR